MPKGQFLYQRIYSDLKTQISEGTLLPKSRLPGEKELGERYQASLITVKKALELLVEEKLVKRIPGQGSFVTDMEFRQESFSPSQKRQEDSGKRDRIIGVILEYAMLSFGFELIYELDRAAREAGYKICFRFSYADRERETEEIRFLLSMGVEGLIILPCHGFYYNTLLLKLVLDHFPVVVLDKKMDGIRVPCIQTDNTDAVYRLVDYLKSRQRTRIGMITVEDMGTITLKERRKAFQERIQQLHLPVMEECILPQSAYDILKHKPIDGYVQEIKDYLKRCGGRLDGVVCMEYGHLLAFLEAVRQLETEWASQILPCCMDDIYLVPGGSRYAHVKQNESAMADKAVELLCAQVNGAKEIQEDIRIPGIFRIP